MTDRISDIDDDISTWFASQGALAQIIPDFRVRTAQQQMAQAVSAAIRNRETLIVEAGTGIGKTFAYLVPALLYGGKVIISTGTKTLQEQLFTRDFPTIRQALCAPITVAILKGRSNYICYYHLEYVQQHGLLTNRQDVNALHAITQFAKYTKTGDKAELTEVSENAPIWDKVTSTHDNCLGTQCSSYQKCFVMQARRRAQQADIVIVNHHLFFADILLKESGISDLLPQANTIIFDEAHQLPEIATLFFGETFSTLQVQELCRDTLVEGLAQARDAYDWSQLCACIEQSAKDCRLSLAQESQKLPVVSLSKTDPLFLELAKLENNLAELVRVLEQQAERSEGLANCLHRTQVLLVRLSSWCTDVTAMSNGIEKNSEEKILWLETYTYSLQLHRTPLSIASVFARQLEEGAKRAWIFTSATLAVRDKFDHYASQLGLNSKKSLVLQSPFDYSQQAVLYVPKDLPLPSDIGHIEAMIEAALPLLEISQGRTFFLCTTLRAVKRVSELLAQIIAIKDWKISLLVQGQMSRNILLDRFRQLGNAILIGSQSFWEGVDVRGNALSLVIIDKLPFSPPDDPVLAARLDALTKAGQSPFQAYQIPQAAITLKQGAGRLIRSERDKGVLMIADTRLVDKPYGRKLWQSLPPFRRTREQAEVINFLRSYCVSI